MIEHPSTSKELLFNQVEEAFPGVKDWSTRTGVLSWESGPWKVLAYYATRRWGVVYTSSGLRGDQYGEFSLVECRKIALDNWLSKQDGLFNATLDEITRLQGVLDELAASRDAVLVLIGKE